MNDNQEFDAVERLTGRLLSVKHDDPTGLLDSAPPSFSKDLKSYVFSYTRITSDLYTAEGLR